MQKPRSSLLFALFLLSGAAHSQVCPTVTDLNRKPVNLYAHPESANAFTTLQGSLSYVEAGGKWYFQAESYGSGRELFVTDGTRMGTHLVKDIHPNLGSLPHEFCAVGSELYFAADDGVNGDELWKTDGTEAGTVMVLDLVPGAEGASLQNFVALGSRLVFSAATASGGQEPWVTDGTAAGTFMLGDLMAGSAGSFPGEMATLAGGNGVLFRAESAGLGAELWVTDGTVAGTQMVRDIAVGSGSSSPENLVTWQGRTYFQADDGVVGSELWSSDGTSAGTVLVADIAPGPTSSDVSLDFWVEANGKLHFSANDGVSGIEPWKTDGTAAGTQLAADLKSGLSGSDPEQFVAIGIDVFCFAKGGGKDGRELHKFDANGVATMVKDINTTWGSYDAFDEPSQQLIAVGGRLYFRPYAPELAGNNALWTSDGTELGTVPFELANGDLVKNARNLTSLPGNSLLFTRGIVGPWISDLTASGTKSLGDLNPQNATASSSPKGLISTNGLETYLVASHADGGDVVWSIGAAGVADELMHTGPGAKVKGDLLPSFLGDHEVTFFKVEIEDGPQQLWSTMGTAANTMLLGEFDHLTLVVNPILGPSKSTILDGGFVFYGASQSGQLDLWTSDGTQSGTSSLLGTATGLSVSPLLFEVVEGRALFLVEDSGAARTLWATDGTAGGTIKLLAGSADVGEDVKALGMIGDKFVFWRGVEAGHGELWSTDAKGADCTFLGAIPGALLLEDSLLTRNPFDALARSAVFQGRLFFPVRAGSKGVQLWATDGSAAGTGLIKELLAGWEDIYLGGFFELGDQLYFTNRFQALWLTPQVWGPSTAGPGGRLFRTDGTTAGTVMVKNLSPGLGSTVLTPFTEVNGKLQFAAQSGLTGPQFWTSDGTSGGTKQLGELVPGTSYAHISKLIAFQGKTYFSLGNVEQGRELFVIDGDVPGPTSFAPWAPGSDSGFSGFSAADPIVGGRILVVVRGAAGDAIVSFDGSAGGVQNLGSFNTSAFTSMMTHAFHVGERLFFQNELPGTGRELWVTDGTAGATQLVCDLFPGPTPSYVGHPTLVGGDLLVSAEHPLYGRELFRFPGVGPYAATLGHGDGDIQLTSTTPLLGQDVTLEAVGIEPGVLSALVISAPVRSPNQLFTLPGQASWIDPASLTVLAWFPLTSWSFDQQIPATPALAGAQLNVQVFAMSTGGILPARVSNGLSLVL